MPEYARVCQSMSEYARVCQSMTEYARVCQSVPEYARVLPSFSKVERFKKGLFIRSFLGTVKKRVLGMLDARGNAMLVFRHFHKSAWKSTRLRLAPTTFRYSSTPW